MIIIIIIIIIHNIYIDPIVLRVVTPQGVLMAVSVAVPDNSHNQQPGEEAEQVEVPVLPSHGVHGSHHLQKQRRGTHPPPAG